MASAEELAGNSALAHMDKVTIYRTLKQLVVAGLIYETQAGHAGVHYQLVEHHTHVVKCVSCGKVDTLEAHDVVLEKKLAAMHMKSFAHIHAHALTFFGTCKTCKPVLR
jgi:Fe2+ or Zn2+ uptake regulation protein